MVSTINKIPICATYSWPLVDNLLGGKDNWFLLIISKICVNQVFTMSLYLRQKRGWAIPSSPYICRYLWSFLDQGQVEIHSLQRDKYFRATRIRYFRWKSLNMRREWRNIKKNLINIPRDSQYLMWPVNCEPSNTFGTLELLSPFPIGSFLFHSKKDRSCFVPKSIVN